jgi:hypothetical protein
VAEFDLTAGEIGGDRKMKQRKERETFKGVNFSALGEAIVAEAKRLLHEKHLSGEFDPSWQTCVQMAERNVIPKFMNVKKEGGYTNGNGKDRK